MVGDTMRRGFTLVEILVAISIIGILSTIGLITYRNVTSQTRDNLRKNHLQQLAVALEIYWQKNSQYVEGAGTCDDTGNFYQTIASYMSNNTVPKDPLPGNVANDRYCYVAINNNKSFRLFAKLENCSKDPQVISGVDCGKDKYNYTLFSEDLASSFVPTTPSPPVGGTPPSLPPFPGCASGKIDQVYSDTWMVGCNHNAAGPAPTFTQAAPLCGQGWRVCSVSEYLARGGKNTPTIQRWLANRAGNFLTCPTEPPCEITAGVPSGHCPIFIPDTNGSWGMVSSNIQSIYTSSCSNITTNNRGYLNAVPINSHANGATCCYF